MNVETAKMRHYCTPGLCSKIYISEIIQLNFVLSFNCMPVAHRTSLNIPHNLYIIIFSVLCTCTLFLDLIFCVVLCVDCCITLGNAAALVY
jgi:hypothetical protein